MINCNKHTDKEIVTVISSGDIDAFYCIVEKYEDKLLKYIFRITNIHLEDAENLLQEVFIKVYKNINDYNTDYQFSSWIYRITHNITIDFHRKNKDKINISLENDDSEYGNLIEIIDSGINIERDFKNKELIKKIVEILNLLDMKYKDILVLKFLEGKNYDEISDILKIPTGTVATLINRGKKQFKQIAEDNNLNTYI
ncbi:MAG: sigma-70 family RNA polymerase sigma factor [Candidatus Gracilibacteria bacterium]